jgi:long-chain acyl-CoA synthetase
LIVENLADYIDMNAVRRAERVALADQTRQVTYAELGREMHRAAAFLQDRGVRRGDIVGLTMRDGVDHVVVMLAIIRLGAILLPMDPRWTSVEKDNVARVFGAAHVVTDAPETCQLTSTPVILPDAAAIAATTRLPDLPTDFSADEPLLMSLSSGTTGTPKGPQLSHRQMMLRHYGEWLSLGFLASDVNLCSTPLYFGGGRGFTLSYLLGGATVVFCPPPYRPDDIAASIARWNVTSTFLVPTLLRRVAESSDEIRAAVRSLRFVICSGSALHPSERRDLIETVNANLMNFYASTEGGGVSILYAQDDESVARSVGRPIPGSKLRILDNDDNILPAGEIGHIAQSAAWHPKGFHRNPEETARYFRDGWYLPGDLGYLDERGYLFITGRAKDMIIRGGVNIYPNEVEAVLVTHQAVSDAAVIGVSSEQFGEEVAAFVVADPAAVSSAELDAHCRASLAAYKIPREFHFVAELPRNTGGKVIKPELVKRAEALRREPA